MQPAEPVCPTIDHDPSVVVLDEQRTMASVLTRARLDLAPRTEKREFEDAFFCRHAGVRSGSVVNLSYVAQTASSLFGNEMLHRSPQPALCTLTNWQCKEHSVRRRAPLGHLHFGETWQ